MFLLKTIVYAESIDFNQFTFIFSLSGFYSGILHTAIRDFTSVTMAMNAKTTFVR